MEWFSSTGFREDLDVTLILISILTVFFMQHRNYKRLKAVLHQAPTAVFLVSKGSGYIRDANQAAIQLLGIRRVGRRFLLPSPITNQALLDMISPNRQSSSQIWAISNHNHKSISLHAHSAKINKQDVWVVHASPVDDFLYSHSMQGTNDEANHAQAALDSLSELIFYKDLNNQLIGKNKAYNRFWLGREKEGCAFLEFDVSLGTTANKRWTTTIDGENCLLETHLSPLINSNGEIVGSLGITHDVTEWFSMQQCIGDEANRRQTIEVELAQRESLLQSVLLSAPDPIAIFDENYVCEVCNQPYAESLGIADKDSLIGHCLDDILPESLVGRFRKTDVEVLEEGRTLRFIDEMKKSNNESAWYDVLKAPYYDPQEGISGYLLIARDVTERFLAEQKLEKANAELEQLSFFDKLTKLSNRRRFDSQLSALWRFHLEKKQPLTIIVCSIDHFKLFNYTYGAQLGDEILIQMATAFTQITQAGADLVARYTDHQFVFLLPDTDQPTAMKMTEQIHQVIADVNIVLDGLQLNQKLTISLGLISVIPEQEMSPEFAIERVTQALDKAKNAGYNQTKVVNYQ